MKLKFKLTETTSPMPASNSKPGLVTADQVACHVLGDYVIQSDWMSQTKTKSSIPAAAHALTYTLGFLPLTRNPKKLFVIGFTHFLIDRFRLARYICWGKNQLSPKEFRYPWSAAKKTGYKDSAPPFLSVWLMIIADNFLHVMINACVLKKRGKR